MYLVISCGLRPESRSRTLARIARNRLQQDGVEVEWLDLQDHELPFCDGGACYADPTVHAVAEKVSAAQGILMASPIYNYDVSGAAKNLIELTGRAWADKVVGFLCAAGGSGSYMSVMGIANSLMLDFRCLILPRFVYASETAFKDDQLADEDVENRIHHLAAELVRLTRARTS